MSGMNYQLRILGIHVQSRFATFQRFALSQALSQNGFAPLPNIAPLPNGWHVHFRPGSPWSGALPCHEDWGLRFALGSTVPPRSLSLSRARPCVVAPWPRLDGRCLATPDMDHQSLHSRAPVCCTQAGAHRGAHERTDLTLFDPPLPSPRELPNGLP